MKHSTHNFLWGRRHFFSKEKKDVDALAKRRTNERNRRISLEESRRAPPQAPFDDEDDEMGVRFEHTVGRG